MALGFLEFADLNEGLVIYALAFGAHIFWRCTPPARADNIPAIEALRLAQKLERHRVESMPVPVYVDTGNANGFAVGLPRLGGSLDDYTDFNRVLPVAQWSVHGDMLNRCAHQRGQALSDDLAVTAFVVALETGQTDTFALNGISKLSQSCLRVRAVNVQGKNL